MSNFWANKLGAASRPAAPAPSPAPQQGSGGAWWRPPTPAPQQAPQTVPQPREEKVPAKAMVTKQNTICPECGGDNFFKPHGMPNAMPQCYECGSNPRFTQTAAGLPSGDKSGPSTPAKQTANGGAGGRNNYNPHMIIKADGTV